MLDTEILDIEFDPLVLEEALEEAQIKQSDFNKLVGFRHCNTLNKIIKRKRIASATDLLRISAALNKNPREFAKVK